MMNRYIILLLAMWGAVPVTTWGEVAGELYPSPDKTSLVSVNRQSEGPNLSVTVFGGPVPDHKAILWHQHLSINPDETVKVWWRPDSTAFMVEHVMKKKQEVRLYAVLVGKHAIIASTMPATNLNDVRSIDGNTINWKSDGSVEFEAETRKGRRTITVFWFCNANMVSDRHTAASPSPDTPLESEMKVATESEAEYLLVQAGAKGDTRFPNRAQDRIITGSFFVLGGNVDDFGRKGDRVWQMHYLTAHATSADAVTRIAWVNAESGKLRLIFPEQDEQRTINKANPLVPTESGQ